MSVHAELVAFVEVVLPKHQHVQYHQLTISLAIDSLVHDVGVRISTAIASPILYVPFVVVTGDLVSAHESLILIPRLSVML